MKKLIFAAMATWTLTFVSLGGSAQTIITSFDASSNNSIQILQDNAKRIYYLAYKPLVDSSFIYKVENTSSTLIFACLGSMSTETILFAPNDAYIYCSTYNKETYKVSVDGSSFEVILNEGSYPLYVRGSELILVRQEFSQEQTLSILNIEDNSIVKNIMSSNTSGGSFIRSSGLVDDKLYFSTGGQYESGIYSYGLSSERLKLVDPFGGPYQWGKGFNNTFAYYTPYLSQDNTQLQTYFITSDPEVRFLSQKVNEYSGSNILKGPDGEFVVITDTTFIALVNGTPTPWNKEYPFWSAAWNEKHIWTQYDEGLEFHQVLLYDGISGDTVTIASINGFLAQDLKVFGNRVYTVRYVQDENTIQLISFDLNCPEYLVIDQEVVNMGQTLFEARHIDVKGLINVSSDIIIRANNDIEITPTSAFYVENGGSVEIRPFACPN